MNFEKEAGGEILGGLAGLLSRPFVGAARSGAVREGIVNSLTKHVNDPLERLLHRVGVGKAVETGARALAYPVPEWVPLAGRLREKSLRIPDRVPFIGGHGSTPFLGTPEARAAWAKGKADGIVNLIAQHPDAAAFSGATTVMAPIPGITEAYLGAKGLATKALEKLTPVQQAAASAPRALPSLPAEPTFLKLPPKVAEAYEAGRKAALEKYAAGWYDLAPVARRMIVGGAIGSLGGAAAGAAMSDEGERGKGALKGGLFGALGGAGAGFGYNASRPIKPSALPGRYQANIGIKTRTQTQDYDSVTSRPTTGRRPIVDSEFRVPSGRVDPQGRPITVSPVMETNEDLGHLVVEKVTARDAPSMEHQDLMALLGSRAYDHTTDSLRETMHGTPGNWDLRYLGSIEHNRRLTPEINEMRRLLRKQQR